MNIRKIRLNDAEAFLKMLKQLDQETSFMLYEPGERRATVAEARKRLETVQKAEREIIFVAESEEGLVGFIEGHGGTLSRNRYCIYIVIGILEDYQGAGIGSKLFEALEEWAREQQIHRLELTVMEHNRPAMYLYEKCGFLVEGMRKRSLYVDGEFINEFYMAKILEESGPGKTK
ncbi:MAG TPA: GNAT family N-acetyltransferase [Bacillales bacterium]